MISFVKIFILAKTPVLWPPPAKSWLIGKDSDAARDWGQEEKETTKDEMAGWHHWLDGRESEWTPGVADGQGGLACCNSWGRKESDMTEQPNWTNWTEDMPSCGFLCLYPVFFFFNFLVAQTLKNLSIMEETQVWSWVGKILWKRAWQPTPVFLPGESHGRGAWWTGYSSRGRKESDTTDRLHFLSSSVLETHPVQPCPLAAENLRADEERWVESYFLFIENQS